MKPGTPNIGKQLECFKDPRGYRNWIIENHDRLHIERTLDYHLKQLGDLEKKINYKPLKNYLYSDYD